MTFKPIDATRDEFRKYLEQTGVLEAVTKVFSKLLRLKERPENALEFVCIHLGAGKELVDTNQHLRQELEDAKNEIARLKRVIENLEAEKQQKPPVATAEEDDNPKTNQNTTNEETIKPKNLNESSSSEETVVSSEESNKMVATDEDDGEKDSKEPDEPSSEKQQEPEEAEKEKNDN